ncbi:hypothetical protein [Candidatus Phyllobacterium onerii]|uniref:hypothetical protein n=1 Tax=Candidatus Phyllobacterium onerii TaxID=3020828 RepID=UPI000DD9557D|nr:hypothetical protein [Phyllobacterium sp. IY22]
MKESRKAQIILRATFYNGLAITLFAVAGLGSYFFFARFSHDRLWGLVILASALLVSIVLHQIGYRHLRRLDED